MEEVEEELVGKTFEEEITQNNDSPIEQNEENYDNEILNALVDSELNDMVEYVDTH